MLLRVLPKDCSFKKCMWNWLIKLCQFSAWLDVTMKIERFSMVVNHLDPTACWNNGYPFEIHLKPKSRPCTTVNKRLWNVAWGTTMMRIIIKRFDNWPMNYRQRGFTIFEFKRGFRRVTAPLYQHHTRHELTWWPISQEFISTILQSRMWWYNYIRHNTRKTYDGRQYIRFIFLTTVIAKNI